MLLYPNFHASSNAADHIHLGLLSILIAGEVIKELDVDNRIRPGATCTFHVTSDPHMRQQIIATQSLNATLIMNSIIAVFIKTVHQISFYSRLLPACTCTVYYLSRYFCSWILYYSNNMHL